MSLAVSPIRYPDVWASDVMTRRAWWLAALNVLIPGSVQVLAGNRRLGRFGLGATLVLWTLAIATVVVFLARPSLVYTVASTTVTLWLASAALLFYAVLWIILTLDTLRLVRLVRATPGSRTGVAVLATIVMIALSGGAAYGAWIATSAGSFLSSVFAAGPSVPPVDGRYNVLLLGADAGPDREGSRPDSMTVVSVDAETGAATMIGLPRDLEGFPFPDDSPLASVYPEGYGALDGCEVDVCMLNSVYTEVELKSPEMYPAAVAHNSEPGIEAMKDAAEGATGLTIPFYVQIDMQGFSELVDALGGVDIDVAERLPIGGDEDNNNVDGWVEAGPQHMDGFTALWYGRARYGTGDYDRMGRQRILQEAILAQFNPANVLTKFEGVANAGKEVVKTDVPQRMLGYFVDLATKTKQLPIETVELTPENGIDPAYPDFGQIHDLIADATAPAASAEE